MAEELDLDADYVRRIYGAVCGAGMAPMGKLLYFRNIHPSRSIRITVKKWWNDAHGSGSEFQVHTLRPNRNIASHSPNEDDILAGCTVDQVHNMIRYYEFTAEWE